MNEKPKYLLKYGIKEIPSDSLEELMRLVPSINEPYEIFRVYKSKFDDADKILNAKMIEEARRMHSRGYSKSIIGKRLGITPHHMNKIIHHSIAL